MLGLADPWVAIAYTLCILSSVLCIIYGGVNWNRGDEPPQQEDRHWAEEEDKFEDKL